MDLLKREYNALNYISGPLLFVRNAADLAYNAIVDIKDGNGRIRGGQVIEVSEEYAVIQVLEETSGLDLARTSVSLVEDVARLGVAKDMLGRRFNGIGKPIDGLPAVTAEKRLPIGGMPINPVSRRKPVEFIQTGISTVDIMNTLVRGQKLPIFSSPGLPANELAAQIARQATVPGEEVDFAVVFAAMGVTQREVTYFTDQFEKTGALSRSVLFLNRADDPTIERILTPRMALTVAEHLAFVHGFHVLVILTDMTNYCEALREVGASRGEIPGRRGYPGYMYTDLSTIYERAGVIEDSSGSVTQIPILSMPGGDRTHPIPDLTGYITEGQIQLSVELNRKGAFPPIDPLPSLSRLANNAIGKEMTREDHKQVSDQLFAAYANGVDLRKLVAIIGEEALTENDQRYLKFADAFENQFIKQGQQSRTLVESLGLAWELLSIMPESELKRISSDHIGKYYGSRLHDFWTPPDET
jgi:V/A-type H+/Na+-transporting ATPase subunit B